jgi:hypothetical protein
MHAGCREHVNASVVGMSAASSRCYQHIVNTAVYRSIAVGEYAHRAAERKDSKRIADIAARLLDARVIVAIVLAIGKIGARDVSNGQALTIEEVEAPAPKDNRSTAKTKSGFKKRARR